VTDSSGRSFRKCFCGSREWSLAIDLSLNYSKSLVITTLSPSPVNIPRPPRRPIRYFCRNNPFLVDVLQSNSLRENFPEVLGNHLTTNGGTLSMPGRAETRRRAFWRSRSRCRLGPSVPAFFLDRGVGQTGLHQEFNSAFS